MTNEPKPASATLQSLYSLVPGVELVHAIAGAQSVTLEALIDGERSARSLVLPAGHYLIVKVIDRPTTRRGLFGVVAPKP